MIEKLPFVITVPSQGLSVPVEDTNAFNKFCGQEMDFFRQHSELLNQPIIVSNTNYGSLQIAQSAQRAWSEILTEGSRGNFGPLNTHLDLAERLEIPMAHGRFGDLVQSKLKSGEKETARWIIYVLSSAWASTSQNPAQAPYRAVLFASPSNDSFGDITSAIDALRVARSAQSSIEDSRSQLEAFIKNKTDLFDHLEDIYRNKLTLEEPAISWKRIANRKTAAWTIWLGIFAALVVSPIAAVAFHWGAVSDAVSKLTAPTSNGSFSLVGLAVITIPALLYGWLLKNVSRVFIQNLNLADDAAHRRSLALTYMGLLQNEKHPATDQDRAIILNALFRPIPPQTADEGPPAGVVDLIKSSK